MGPDYQKWVGNGSEMGPDYQIWVRNGSEMSPDYQKWVRNGSEMTRIPEMGQEWTGNGFKSLKNGFRLSKIISNGSKSSETETK